MGNCTSSPMFISRIVPTMLFCATVVSILYNVLMSSREPRKGLYRHLPHGFRVYGRKIKIVNTLGGPVCRHPLGTRVGISGIALTWVHSVSGSHLIDGSALRSSTSRWGTCHGLELLPCSLIAIDFPQTTRKVTMCCGSISGFPRSQCALS